MPQRHLALTICGHVTGVFFRAQSAAKAKELGLTGFVGNRPDGIVYLEAEGEEAALQELLSWCQQGPSQAQVASLEPTWSDQLAGYTDFTIRR